MEKIPKQYKNNIIKIVVFGPESTGKTTLCKRLASYYQTVWVPEFSRTYAEEKWEKHQKPCEETDIMPIAIGQMTLENSFVNKANQLLICDTDLLETKVYAEHYYNKTIPDLEEAITNNDYSLYLLSYIDVPWEPDGIRDQPHNREVLFTAFENALINYKKPYILLTGDEDARFTKAIFTIENLLAKIKTP